jgi:hypothetical protein
MRRKAHVLALGLLDDLNVSCVALGGIPNLLLSPQVLEVGGGGCPTLKDGDAFISGRVEAVLSPGLNLSAIHSSRLLLSK